MNRARLSKSVTLKIVAGAELGGKGEDQAVRGQLARPGVPLRAARLSQLEAQPAPEQVHVPPDQHWKASGL